MSRAGRIHRAPLALAALITVVIGAGGGAGVYFAADRQEGSVGRQNMEGALATVAANEGQPENFLIVGSDSREGADAEAEDAGVIGDDGDVTGSRSDSIMILRRDPEGGASLLSIPRDLWVPIAGTGESGKINGAFNGGGSRLAQTITQALGIPIHHYIEIDFDGFSRLVDSFGGVEICVENPAQDLGSGLVLQGGCQILAGPQALAFVRSRTYEEWIDGDWVPDNKNDLGRIERQQLFLRRAATEFLDELKSNPFLLGNMLEAAGGLVTFDENLNFMDAGESLRAAVEEGLHTYQLPVVRAQHGNNDALDLDPNVPETEIILDYFRGVGPLPPVPTTTVAGEETDASDGD